MPDGNGRIKGISVPRIPWLENKEPEEATCPPPRLTAPPRCAYRSTVWGQCALHAGHAGSHKPVTYVERCQHCGEMPKAVGYDEHHRTALLICGCTSGG